MHDEHLSGLWNGRRLDDKRKHEMTINLTRENYIWLAAEVMAERTASSAILLKLMQGKTLDDVREFIESLLNDPHRLRDFLSEDLDLVEGATDSDLDLLFDEYLPTLLKNQIEYIELLPDTPILTDDELPAEVVVVRERKIGFVH